jgi:hypothetical protein
MKNGVFWDVAPYRSCVNRRFGGTYRLHLLGIKIRELTSSRWFFANVAVMVLTCIWEILDSNLCRGIEFSDSCYAEFFLSPSTRILP